VIRRGAEKAGNGHEVTLWLVVIATFLASLSNNVLGVAVPVVVRHFHADAFEATLVLLVPSLTSTTTVLVLGRAGDLLGRRPNYIAGLTLFTISSLLLGFSVNVWMVILLQVVRSFGVATLWANSAAILVEELPSRRRQRGLGLYIAAVAVAQLIGPTLGGIVADTIGWRWIFWINVPAGAACVLWSRRRLPRRPAGVIRRESLDLPGGVLLLVGLSSVVVSISLAESFGTIGVASASALAGGFALLVAFVLRESSVATPLLDLSLFRDRAFSLAMLSGVLNAMAEWGPVILMVLFFQAVRGLSPLRAGLTVVPLPVFTGVFSALAGRLSRRASGEALSVLGSLVATGGLVALALSLSGSYDVVEVALGVVGAGSGIFMPANTNVLLSRASVSTTGLINGTRLTLQNVGWVTSAAIALTLAVAGLPVSIRHEFFAASIGRLSPGYVEQLLNGYRIAVGLLAFFAFAGALTAVAAQPARALRRIGPVTRASGPDEASTVLD